MNSLFLVYHYVVYLFRAKDEHSLHSPFAYDFYTTVLKNKKPNPIFQKIETLRKQLKSSSKKISVTDFGAGSSIHSSTLRSISSICKHSEKRPALAQLLFRIIERQQPTTLLDLGTSFGLTTLYQSMAQPTGKVYSFEGCTETAKIATENFKTLESTNITLIQGNIDTTLPEVLATLNRVDFVFFDANHRYAPTLNYFEKCLSKSTEDSVFVFDDIYWSKEMMDAWEAIKKHPSVGMTFDLFFIGIVFFRKKQPVQHFTVR